jgi:hypothetical protein
MAPLFGAENQGQLGLAPFFRAVPDRHDVTGVTEYKDFDSGCPKGGND